MTFIDREIIGKLLTRKEFVVPIIRELAAMEKWHIWTVLASTVVSFSCFSGSWASYILLWVGESTSGYSQNHTPMEDGIWLVWLLGQRPSMPPTTLAQSEDSLTPEGGQTLGYQKPTKQRVSYRFRITT